MSAESEGKRIVGTVTGIQEHRLAGRPDLYLSALMCLRQFLLWVLPLALPFLSAILNRANYRRLLIYNKDRIFAFVMALGYVSDEWYATAAGALNFGFPVIADTPIPEILPSGIATYEHVVANVPHDKIVARAIEVRGLKVAITKVPVPVAYGPAYEGERVRGEDIYLECGGGRTPMVEWVTSKPMDES